MGTLGEQIVTVLTAIIGVAMLAVIVSRNSDTRSVVTSTSDAFAAMLSMAVSPITGNVPSPSTGFAGSGFRGSIF